MSTIGRVEVVTIECQAAGPGRCEKVAESAQDGEKYWGGGHVIIFQHGYAANRKSQGSLFFAVDDAAPSTVDVLLSSLWIPTRCGSKFMYPECKPQSRLLLGYVLCSPAVCVPGTVGVEA